MGKLSQRDTCVRSYNHVKLRGDHGVNAMNFTVLDIADVSEDA